MENFNYYNPVKLHFGKGCTNELGKIASEYGKKALLIYGKGSVKKNGIYDIIVNELGNLNIEIVEFSGIKANPLASDTKKIVEIAINSKVDLIVALGGGSVIDTAKIAALCIPSNANVWDVMKYKVKPPTALPILAILTLAATGTEMNAAAVLQNSETGEKIGYVNPLIYPKHSFLDPEFTYSVSKYQTANGIVDLIAHAFEAWFANGNSSIADKFVSSIITEAIELSDKVLAYPNNYEYRSSMMLLSTCALNGITSLGRRFSGDWGVHDLGHTLSYLFDTAHGASLSIAYPAWLKLQKERIPERISSLGKSIFNEPNIDRFIHKLEQFFISINSPVRLSDISINSEQHKIIADLMQKNSITGLVHKLSGIDYLKIIELMDIQ